MGLEEVLRRTAEGQQAQTGQPVTPVTLGYPGEVTEKSLANQRSNPGYPGYPEKRRGAQQQPAPVDVDAVLEQAAQGTEVSAALLRAALTAEDLEEIHRGRETAETLRGVAWALPDTPGLLERAQRRLAEQQAEQSAEEPQPIEVVAGITAADVARACRAFYRHVAQDCCNPAHGRYCPEGLRLKADYERASAACDAPPWRKGLSGASGTEEER